MMCTCAKQKHVASDRARRENVTVKNTTNIEREELRQMKTNTDLFEKTPVPKAVATMAVPTMISMLVVVIYNMADTFFIGQTKDPLQVAAVSLATPVFMIFMALGHLFGIGGSSAISRALGERHKDRACHISSFCCYGSLGLGVIVAILSVLGMETILHLIGASVNTIGFARQYLAIIAIGAPFIMFSTAFANILRGEGASREDRNFPTFFGSHRGFATFRFVGVVDSCDKHIYIGGCR